MDKSDRLILPWTRQSSETLADYRVFKMTKEVYLRPDGSGRHDFYVMLPPDWATIVPVTEDGRVVLIRQFRVGTAEVTIEVPGGVIEKGEDPESAARRELQEETGFLCADIIKTAAVRPNPAISRNTCYHFVATGCTGTGVTHFDETEDVGTFLATWDEIDKMISDGRIDHALILTALFFAKRALARG